jgi:hypothetical protein
VLSEKTQSDIFFMKKFNFIAFLGLYLAISPQAMGRDQHNMMLTKMVVEVQMKTPQSQQQQVKKFPFPKKYRLSLKPTLSFSFLNKKNIASTHTSKPVVVNVKRNIRPKIIEENCVN